MSKEDRENKKRKDEEEETIKKQRSPIKGPQTKKPNKGPSNTNITIKPNSCQHPRIAIGNFKAELCRAHRICSSPNALTEEIKFITNLFSDNGHEVKELEKIIAAYSPPSLKPTYHKNKKSPNSHKPTHSEIPENLFEVLPFHYTDISNEEEYKPFARIPFLPGNIFHQIKRSLSKAGINTCPTSGQKLLNVLCGKNKTRPPQEEKKGVYRLNCPCNDKAIYVGQTIRSIKSRCKEHKTAAEKENWQHSGISQHKEQCDQPVDWENPVVLKTMSGKSKKKLAYDLKVREALEIRRQNCGPGHGLNEDFGAYVKSTQWNAVFHAMSPT